MFSVLQIFHNGKLAILELSDFERLFCWFWLFGPFFLWAGLSLALAVLQLNLMLGS